MADVVPLRSDRPDRVPIAPPSQTAPDRIPAPDRPAADAAHDLESSFVAPGLDRRELRRLKRGDYAVDRRLDLHGQKADEAVATVQRFLESARHARHRAVCIVHGRGLNSKDGVAILKTRVRAFLRSHRAVLAFADAPFADGGPGAVYVLLRQ